MRVGLNATCLNDRPSGAKQRFVGIYGELMRRLRHYEFIVYEPAECRIRDWFPEAPNVTVRSTRIPSEGRAAKVLSNVTYWRSAPRDDRLDVLEWFHLPMVRVPTKLSLLTLHDIRGLREGEGPIRRAIYASATARSIKAADHVITVSNAMREQILDRFPGLSISVVYNGVADGERVPISSAELTLFRLKHKLPDTFILAVGHLEKRKNYRSLIDAIEILGRRSCACPLLIVGNDNGEREVLEEHIAALGLSTAVTILDSLSDREVRCAYRLCSLFVFPSTYEGFGIPILEAMAAGKPMVLSDIAVFREITEGRSVYFPCEDPEALACSIEHMLECGEERAQQVAYGCRRVRDFSFQKIAAQLGGLYEKLL